MIKMLTPSGTVALISEDRQKEYLALGYSLVEKKKLKKRKKSTDEQKED